jgi:transposase
MLARDGVGSGLPGRPPARHRGEREHSHNVMTSTAASDLNTVCTCTTLDRDALCRALEASVGDAEFCNVLARSHANLIAAQPLFLSQAQASRMAEVVAAIEAIAKTKGYQSAALAWAPQSARADMGPIGVMMGYDFHLSDNGPKLIEINTNAGGALINAYLLQAQRRCCRPLLDGVADATSLIAAFVDDFRREWRRQGRTRPLETIAIVDQSPAGQYLYPEFVLFERLFASAGLGAIICGPEALDYRDGALWAGTRPIDLVYNRLTDFDLSAPEHAALLRAYLEGSVAVTPNPHAHALLADKRNLTLLTDTARLKDWGNEDDVIAIAIDGIPKTTIVTADNRDALWARRDTLFFKPWSGYGSKAAYRGDKITRKVWAEIAQTGYVAQEVVAPSERQIVVDGVSQRLKADLRAFTYDGQVRLMAARLYQGQTTNFRTPGGGFAPVFIGGGPAVCTCQRGSSPAAAP